MNILFVHFLQVNTPVPRDIPIPLPLPEWLLVVLLVFSFLLHIVFVNLMLGGSIVTLWAEIKGLKNKFYDTLAYEVARTITVNKSLAVVLGVAPLLSINALYTIYFYSANALTGIMWILIIPLVAIAFLLTYLHKYTWHSMERFKILHIGIIALSVLLFLFIPLIFLVNINLMLFPEKWSSIHGFISALFLPNVFPRYFHFLFASLAVTGLFLFWYVGRKNYPFETIFPNNYTRYDVKKIAYSLTLGASVAQFLIGPIVLISLPSKGFGWGLLSIILLGASLALIAMWWIWKALSGPKEAINKRFGGIVVLMTITVLFMGSGRHVYRANALNPHRELMAIKTAEFEKLSANARLNVNKDEASQSSDNALSPVEKGAALFKTNCSICHQKDTKLVGPPITEMVSIYKNNISGLEQWIKAPGKKRPDYPQMPTLSQLSDADRENLAKYILSVQ
jgi:cytochrome c